MTTLDRRTFLRRLGFGTVAAAAAATSVYDLERLLWVPGEKTIVLPAVQDVVSATRIRFVVGDIFTFEGFHAFDPRTGRPLAALQEWIVVAAETSDADAVFRPLPPVLGRHEPPQPGPRRPDRPRRHA